MAGQGAVPMPETGGTRIEDRSSSEVVYRETLETLHESSIPFLVGGGYAFNYYTGLDRSTRDFDLFIRESHVAEALRLFESRGFETSLRFPHWLAKVSRNGHTVDLIFNSGNGTSPVDDQWFEYSNRASILDLEVRICPVEEMIWSKSFIMERERYDGSDVAHLLHSRGESLDWPRLLARFGTHWRVLLSHLILFLFIYPFDRTKLPEAVSLFLIRRLRKEMATTTEHEKVCNGTLLSRAQYLVDVDEWGYRDGRLDPPSAMRKEDIERWTRAMREEGIL